MLTKLLNKIKRNRLCVKNVVLKPEHMPIYFPKFINYSEDQWELEFSLGNGISVLFSGKDSLVYRSEGDEISGYSTILYSQNVTINELQRLVKTFQSEEYKLALKREEKLDQLGI